MDPEFSGRLKTATYPISWAERWPNGVRDLASSGNNAPGQEFVERLVKTIALIDDFCHANDPYEEHDFGFVEIEGYSILFKIDLYEEPDVKDANGKPVVTRVLTIMLAEEY